MTELKPIEILISPQEPAEFHPMGKLNGAIEKLFGADFACGLEGGIAAVQRKEFPSDFLGSISDGRMMRLLPLLGATQFPLMLIEGSPPQYASNGALIRFPAYSRAQINGMLFSIQIEHQIQIIWTLNKSETIATIYQFFNWLAKDGHKSFSARPGPKGVRECKTFEEYISRWRLHFTQGLPGVGPTHAKNWIEHCGFPFELKHGMDLATVPGFGKKKIAEINAVFGRK